MEKRYSIINPFTGKEKSIYANSPYEAKMKWVNSSNNIHGFTTSMIKIRMEHKSRGKKKFTAKSRGKLHSKFKVTSRVKPKGKKKLRVSNKYFNTYITAFNFANKVSLGSRIVYQWTGRKWKPLKKFMVKKF